MASVYLICLFMIFNLFSIILTEDEINRRTNTRCEQICDDNELEIQEKLKPDCERGCRYFNIEFLTSAGNSEKVTDLNSTENQCKASCDEAYEEVKPRHACQLGCSKMFALQSKAPYIHGWLVYMGASDRSMVLMQPDFELESEDDWIIFDSVFHPRDYEMNGESYKLTETRVQTMPIYPMRKNIRMEFCVPAWMWMIPIFLVLSLIWMQYGHTIRSIFIYDECDDHNDTIEGNEIIIKDKNFTNNYLVAVDSYFYPSPAVPPPKYLEIEEECLLSSSDEDEASRRQCKYQIMA